MKRIVFFILCCIFVLKGGITHVSPSKDYAIVIGCCSEYMSKDVNPLYGTFNDARHIREILVERGVNPNNIDYFVEKKATYQNITKSIKSMQSKNLRKGDKLYVYYSGRGLNFKTLLEYIMKKNINIKTSLLNKMNNSFGLVPFDFNLNSLENTFIIASKDFEPTFKYLDDKGVEIIIISDSSYTDKFIQRQYKNLLFYGASEVDANESINNNEQRRGMFTVAVEECLSKSRDTITNGKFKMCLKKKTPSYVFYPVDNSLNNRQIIKSKIGKDKKIALLIGNKDYHQKSLILRNPLRDIKAMEKTLIKIGFKVFTLPNATKKSLKKALRDFDNKAQNADIALIYYSGHGLQAFDIDSQSMQNYIVPVEADVQTLGDLDELVRLNNLIYYSFGSSKTQSIVLIDACRDNPLYASLKTKTSKSNALSKGLKRPVTIQNDILIGYATQSNRIANDGSGNLSPYAKALSENLDKNLDIRIVLGMVREDVIKYTNNKQEPESISKLAGREICLSGSCD